MGIEKPACGSIPPCRRCGAAHVVRGGRPRSGAPDSLCRGCGRNSVAAPGKGPVPEGRKALVRRLLLGRPSLRAIARAVGASRPWLQGFVDELYREEVPRGPAPPREGRAG